MRLDEAKMLPNYWMVYTTARMEDRPFYELKS